MIDNLLFCKNCQGGGNKLFEMTNEIYRVIIRAKSEYELFSDICRVAVHTGKYSVCWIGEPDHETQLMNYIVSYNSNDEDIEVLNNYRFNDESPTGRVLRSGTYYLTNDFNTEPWSEQLKKYLWSRGFQSYLTLPIKKGGTVKYTLNVYSDNKYIFSQDQLQFLEGISDDISYAIDNIENQRLKNETQNRLNELSSFIHRAESTAHIGSWKVNFESQLVTCSEGACRIYGFDKNLGTYSYNDWLSFIHPDDLEDVIKSDEEALKTFSNTEKVFRIVRQDNTIRHVNSVNYFDLNSDGVAIGMYGIIYDVTDIKESEDALQQSESNFKLMMDLIPQSIFLKDLDGYFIYANKSYCDLYGMSVKDLNFKNWRDIQIAGNDPNQFIKVDTAAVETGKTQRLHDFLFIDYQGNERVFDIIKTPFYIPATKRTAILGILNDITEQKKADKDKNDILDDLIQRNRNLEQFSYIISHNLRSPLANILGISKALDAADITSEDAKLLIEGLMLSSEKLDSVIRDLNSILHMKHTNLVKEDIDLVQLLSDIKQSIFLVLQREHVVIKDDFSEISHLFSVKTYLYSIFINLISNSIKYRRKDIDTVIEICCTRNSNGILLSFKDNGTGIDMQRNGDKVFGLYNRFHQSIEGNGVGLYMVKTQVEAIDGKISVESEVNVGTTFTIQLKTK